MWPKRAHLLTPLTQLCSSKVKFTWNDNHESAFQQIKRLVTEDVLLRFPDYNKPFSIYTDASKYQIGATIKQENLPVAYFSRKLTPTQRRYSTIEQEMLAIVEVLKEYRNFLLGAQIDIYTDHKNLLADNSVNDRVFRWKQKIQEYGPSIIYIKGHKNIEADALSRLPIITMDEGMTSMMNHPPIDPNNPILNKNPLDLTFLQSFQQRDTALQTALKEDDHFSTINIKGTELIIHKSKPLDKGSIVIPFDLQYPTIRWLHSILGHAGITRLHATMRTHFWFPYMLKTITSFVRQCPYCQRYNKQVHKYGHVPPKEIQQLQPWDEVCVDMIGPWTVKIKNVEYKFRALTCIDTIICLPEIIPVPNATSRTVAEAFEDNWLSRYPTPGRCLHDNGNEFLGYEFSTMLMKNNIKSVPTSVKNPQANAIVERLHQTISTMIAISLQENPPTEVDTVSTLIHRKCMAAQFAYRATKHSVLNFSPGELAFGRNMLFPFSNHIDWKELLTRKQDEIDKGNIKENKGRRNFDYKVGDLVLILNKATFKGKLEPQTLPEGPWKVLQVHTNGTVSILRNLYVERINIRRIRPFFSQESPQLVGAG